LINLFLREILSLEGSPFNIYTLQGMILVEGLLDLPIAYLILAPAMASFDVSFEESSRVCGASNLRTLTRVTLPVLRPAILASFILVIVRSLASFAVPSVIGMPGRIYVLATHIYRIIATGFAADYGMAAAVGMSALAASITLIYLYRYLTSESEKYVTISSRGYNPSVIDLKNAKYPLFGIVGILSLVLIILPVLVLFYISLVPYSMVPSAKAFSMMSWKHWIEVLRDPISLLSLRNSVFLGVVGASLGVTLSVFVAYVIVKIRTRASGLLESLSFLSFSFPGIVVGVGFMWFFCPYASLCHDLGTFDRVYRHISSLRDSAAHECLRSNSQPPRRIVQSLRRRDPLYTAPGYHTTTDSRYSIGMDSDGHYVCAGIDTLGCTLQTRNRSPGCADFPFCRRWFMGATVRPGDYNDFHLLNPGCHCLLDRSKADESGNCQPIGKHKLQKYLSVIPAMKIHNSSRLSVHSYQFTVHGFLVNYAETKAFWILILIPELTLLHLNQKIY